MRVPMTASVPRFSEAGFLYANSSSPGDTPRARFHAFLGIRPALLGLFVHCMQTTFQDRSDPASRPGQFKWIQTQHWFLTSRRLR